MVSVACFSKRKSAGPGAAPGPARDTSSGRSWPPSGRAVELYVPAKIRRDPSLPRVGVVPHVGVEAVEGALGLAEALLLLQHGLGLLRLLHRGQGLALQRPGVAAGGLLSEL